MFDIRSLTWDEWSYPGGVILPIVTLGSIIIKLYSETQVSGRLGMSGGISPRHAQNPLSGEQRKTLSITNHALSPPPTHHHMCIIHLINWLQRFYRIIMSLKRPFVPKSDIKQWFTTTTKIEGTEWSFFSVTRSKMKKRICSCHFHCCHFRLKYLTLLLVDSLKIKMQN